MSDIAIRVENLGKRYRIGGKHERYKTLRDTLADTLTAPIRGLSSLGHGGSPNGKNAPKYEEIWALRDVSFEVKAGQAVGIIGRNGAGKSTLLKILSRITEPTEGVVDIYGRVASLLEVGTGFHPELTGRENIYLNGAILGMKRAEIDRKFDEIVAFAEVEKFIDTAVKHYSSGMYLRLAFAVAAHLEPEILLVDEVLAVGDAAFQRKCLGRMGEVAQGGRTVLFVSHNLAALRQLCSHSLLLTNGCIDATGMTEYVIREYITMTMPRNNYDLISRSDRKGAGDIKFAGISFTGPQGAIMPTLISGHAVDIVLKTASQRAFHRIRVSLMIRNELEQPIMLLDSKFSGEELAILPAGGALVCHIPRVHLAPGRYQIELWLQSVSQLQDWITNAGILEVVDGDFFGTGRSHPEGFVALMDFSWQVSTSGSEEQA